MPEVRLIDANAFTEQYGNYYAEQGTEEGFIGTVGDLIAKQPTIEPEVRHGRWIFKKGDNKTTVDGWICTNCKSGFHTKVPYFECFKFCPMCGARMDGGADNG